MKIVCIIEYVLSLVVIWGRIYYEGINLQSLIDLSADLKMLFLLKSLILCEAWENELLTPKLQISILKRYYWMSLYSLVHSQGLIFQLYVGPPSSLENTSDGGLTL